VPLVHCAGEKLQESNWINMLQVQSLVLILQCFMFLFFSIYPPSEGDNQDFKKKKIISDDFVASLSEACWESPG
jgi:hypothetical protein